MPATKPQPPSPTHENLPSAPSVASEPFVGRWNRLVSTTNWEKGRIIAAWREDLIASGAAPSEYADEAWARLVGGVTGQHVGRLRRVFQRFAAAYEQYEGLYWSHFQAALDWDDAEMWLEGAVQSDWSVSQMRHQRWETLGAVAGARPDDADVVLGELDEDFEPAQGARPETLQPRREPVKDAPRRDGPDFGDDDGPGQGRREERSAVSHRGERAADAEEGAGVIVVRPFENLAEMPDDLAEAFETFKLAILRHKTADWEEISRDDVLACLDALKQLALAADGVTR